MILNVESTEGGSISPKEGQRYYSPDEEVTLIAEPEPGFLFVGWVGDTENVIFSGDQITVTMDKDRNIAATFIEIPQVVDVPIVPLPWDPIPEDELGPPVDVDLESLDLPPFPPEGIEPQLEGFQGPWIDINPRGESFGENIGEGTNTGGSGLVDRDFPWVIRPDFSLGVGLEQPRQIGDGEKPSEKLPVSYLRRLEVVVSPGRGGAVEVVRIASERDPSGFRKDPAVAYIGDYAIKPSSGPDGTWQGSMTCTWMIWSWDTIKLVAKPFEGYRFVRWVKEDYVPRESTYSEYSEAEDLEERVAELEAMAAGPEILNPENPELTINRLRGDLRIHAYFAQIISEIDEPQDALPEDDLDVDDDDTEDEIRSIPIEINITTTSETVEDESGCSSIVTIDYGANDTSNGSHLISYVQLDIDGDEEYSWSGTPEPTDHYQDDYLLESGCSEVRVIQVKAINKDGQTMTATREAKIAPLSTHFTYGILDAPSEGDCKMQLFINYQAVDLGTPENPITNVVVKANGVTWQNSGSISSLWYENSFSRLVDCGNMYTIEVIGTDSDGNKYTYRERIQIPVETPPDESPPPPPPQTTLYAALAASAQCTAYGYECSCQLSISFDGKDLTLGDYPVKQVILKVNGTEWYNSGTITETHHHNSVTRTVGCGQTFNMELTVKNTLGQIAASTGSITTPIP